MHSRTASCCCGQLRIEVRGEPRGVGVCHCLACQRRTGSVFAALAAFAAPYEVFGQATDYVRVGDAWAKRFQCWATGGEPDDLPRVGEAQPKKVARDVFAYVIHEGKVRAPAGAMELIARLR